MCETERGLAWDNTAHSFFCLYVVLYVYTTGGCNKYVSQYNIPMKNEEIKELNFSILIRLLF